VLQLFFKKLAQYLLFSEENENKVKCTPATYRDGAVLLPRVVTDCCCAIEQVRNSLSRSVRLLSLVSFTIIVN